MTSATALLSDSTMWMKKAVAAMAVALFAFVFLTAERAYAQTTFTTQSVPDNFTGVFADADGRTITVNIEPQSGFCAVIQPSGYVGAYARSSVPECDRSIEFTFETNGFLIQSITFADMDDLDGTAPRDSLAMDRAGTWTSPSIEIHSFASPPAFADQAARLTASGAVGTFIANSTGSNPTNETATFTMSVPTTTFRMFHDDTEGGRDALVWFDLNNIQIVTAQGNVIAVTDMASVASSTGGTNVLNVYAGDTLNTITAGVGNTTLALASGSTLPSGFTFDTATGNVSVAAGTPVGVYSFDYEICEIGFPTNCSTATATVTVTGNLDLSITKTNGTTEVTSGTSTTYTTTVTHVSGDPVVGAVVIDSPGAGITCAASAPVTITGSGVPAGSFTFAELSGGGITLGTLTSGQTTTLSYSCQVN